MGTSEPSLLPERDEISALKEQISSQTARIAILEEQLRLATLQRFAPKTEKLASLGDLTVFNEAEHLCGASDDNEASAPDATEITVPARTGQEDADRRDAATPTHRA